MNGFTVDPTLARFAIGAGELTLVGSVLVMCLFAGAISVLALRTTAFPRWLGWVGFAAVILALVEAVLLPIFVMPVWVAIVSLALIVRRPAEVPRMHEAVA